MVNRRLPVYFAGIALALALLATVLYVIQGGFGAGLGTFDQVLFAFGLRWVFIPNPFPPTAPDFLWLILLPLFANFFCAAALALFLRAMKRSAGAP